MNGSGLVRPYGIVVDGRLELGLEVIVEDGRVKAIRPHTGLPEPFILSNAFWNAHSHLEYRGLLGVIHETGYWNWIREITRRKSTQGAEEIVSDCKVAARENHQSGVWFIDEHSDRIGAAEAMTAVGLIGAIFQEVITFFERESPEDKLEAIRKKAEANRKAFDGPVYLNPHAYQTVDEATLMSFAGKPISIHVAETELENSLTQWGSGEIADFYRSAGYEVRASGQSVVQTLDSLGLAHDKAQFVHCCAVSEADIQLMAERKVRVAHCPRSNTALGCPPAPIREMLDAGIAVGLGMDSAASSGAIDFFEEMRSALATSLLRGGPISAEEVWRMATGPTALEQAPLIKIGVEGCLCTEDILGRATRNDVEWLVNP